MNKLFNYIFYFFLLLASIVLIKFSNLPLIDLPLKMENLFIKPNNHDGIVFNLAIGYIVSSIFYLIVVFWPEHIKRNKITRIVNEELSTVYFDALYLIALIYKNTCTKEEWDAINVNEDSELFNKKFYDVITKFDIYKSADTIICYKEKPYHIIEWYQKIKHEFDSFIQRIDNTLNRYLVFFDDDFVDDILAFRNNILITSYLGMPSTKVEQIITSSEGKKYYEMNPLYMSFNDVSGNKKTPIFAGRNLTYIKDYITTLLKIKKYFIRTRTYSVNRALKILNERGCGQVGIARVEYDKFEECQTIGPSYIERMASKASISLQEYFNKSIQEINEIQEKGFSKQLFDFQQILVCCQFTSESILILVAEERIWDAEILFRTLLEGTLKTLYLSIRNDEDKKKKTMSFG